MLLRARRPECFAGTPEPSLVGRIVLIVLIVLAVIFLIRGFGRARARDAGDQVKEQELLDQRMVQCAHCGVYVPESGAVAAAGLHFCSDEHRRLSGK